MVKNIQDVLKDIMNILGVSPLMPLTLLGDRKVIRPVKLLLQNPLGWCLMEVNMVQPAGYSPQYHMGTKSFGLSCEDAQDEDDWRLRIGGNWLTEVYLENGRGVCVWVCVS